ncbi:hypothetical protein BH24DEI2_BH24DEI2_19300 [soil metagenome]
MEIPSPTAAVPADKANTSFWHKHWQKVLAVLFWLLLVGTYLFPTRLLSTSATSDDAPSV